jgi:hypothetical protein
VALALSFAVDTVAPAITVTTALTEVVITSALTGTITVLSGTVSDGGQVNSVFVSVRTPGGSFATESVALTDGNWRYDMPTGILGQYTLWVNAVDEAGNVALAGPYQVEVKVPPQLQRIYLPFVLKNYKPELAAPDLVVRDIIATSNNVQMIIENQGSAPVTDEFWIDVYIDPDPAPTAVNQSWGDLADEGLVWGITAVALPLEAGGVITLTVGDAYYWSEHSQVSWPLPTGRPVYVQVDSVDADTTYGAVLEGHEVRGEAYNNIAGPVYSTIGEQAEPPPTGDRPPMYGNLPPRHTEIPEPERPFRLWLPVIMKREP